VSADSRTLYRGMDIGTAKPSAEDRRRVPHHLLDVASPDALVTLAVYQRLAREAIASIRARGRVPLLVGGTGLYIRAVVDGLAIPAAAPDWRLRALLEAEERAGGPGTLHGRLRDVDPEAAQRIHPRNVRRIIRALEVYARTGRPISALQRGGGLPPAAQGGDEAPEGAVMIALTLERAALYERIERRIRAQVAAGLVAEVRRLLDAGFGPDLPAMQALGYREIVPYLEGRRGLAESLDLLARNTRRYAKRQLTWFRADPRYRWLDAGDDAPEALAGRIAAIVSGHGPAPEAAAGRIEPA
jgi:tRNA dimethylallyltransferase